MLKLISSGAIKGPFILRIISVAILVIALQYAFWKEKSIFAYLFWGLPLETVLVLETVLGGVGNFVCIASFICLMALLWVLYSKTEHLPLNITSEKGKLIDNNAAILSCTIAMTFCVVSMFLRKHVLNKIR
jgi:hypothetical protein